MPIESAREIHDGPAYLEGLERRYRVAFPSTPVPYSYLHRSYPELWPVMEAAIAAGVALTPESLMAAQGKVMPPRDVEV